MVLPQQIAPVHECRCDEPRAGAGRVDSGRLGGQHKLERRVARELIEQPERAEAERAAAVRLGLQAVLHDHELIQRREHDGRVHRGRHEGQRPAQIPAAVALRPRAKVRALRRILPAKGHSSQRRVGREPKRREGGGRRVDVCVPPELAAPARGKALDEAERAVRVAAKRGAPGERARRRARRLPLQRHVAVGAEPVGPLRDARGRHPQAAIRRAQAGALPPQLVRRGLQAAEAAEIEADGELPSAAGGEVQRQSAAPAELRRAAELAAHHVAGHRRRDRVVVVLHHPPRRRPRRGAVAAGAPELGPAAAARKAPGRPAQRAQRWGTLSQRRVGRLCARGPAAAAAAAGPAAGDGELGGARVARPNRAAAAPQRQHQQGQRRDAAQHRPRAPITEPKPGAQCGLL